MKRTLNALTTKIAGRVKPFLNIPTALMMALAVGGFTLSLWMVDDSMTKRVTYSHPGGGHPAHSSDPKTDLSTGVTFNYNNLITVSVFTRAFADYHPVNAPGYINAPTCITARASASGAAEITATNVPNVYRCTYYLWGYARAAGWYDYINDNAKSSLIHLGTRVVHELICEVRHRINPLTGNSEPYYWYTPRVTADGDADIALCSLIGSTDHAAHARVRQLTVDTVPSQSAITLPDVWSEHGVGTNPTNP